MGNNSLIEIIDYTKSFKDNLILNKININIEKGKCYGFIGHNGCGKSVFFKSICGFVKGDSGEIKYEGKVIGKDIDFPENVGIIIESPGFIMNYSGLKNLKLLASINNKIGDKEIKEAIEIVKLDHKNKKKVKNYSLGMKQRLAIAQAIMEKPDVLILDEPMNGLDSEGVELVRQILLELKKVGTTILLTSHNKEDIDILCDEVYKFEKGNIELISN